jgi:hypothetical protein
MTYAWRNTNKTIFWCSTLSCDLLYICVLLRDRQLFVGDRHLGGAYDLGLWRAPFECTEKYTNINNLLTVMTMLFWVLIPCKQPSSALKMDKVFFPETLLFTNESAVWHAGTITSSFSLPWAPRILCNRPVTISVLICSIDSPQWKALCVFLQAHLLLVLISKATAKRKLWIRIR